MFRILLFVFLSALPHITSAAAGKLMLDDDRWHMLSIPGSDAATLREVFGKVLPASRYEKTWIGYRFDARAGVYVTVALDERLAPGSGFWFIHRTGRSVAVEFAGRQPTSAIVRSLGKATNSPDVHLLGTPAINTTSVSDLQIVSDGSVSDCRSGCGIDAAAASGYVIGKLWIWDPAAADYRVLGASDTLDAWQGFWLPVRNSSEAGAISVRFSATTGTPGSSGPSGTRADTFGCLDRSADVVPVTGVLTSRYTPDLAPGRAFDARRAEFYTDNARWGAIDLKGDGTSRNTCWAGGFVHSSRPYDASWLDHKAVVNPDDPSRNSTAIENRGTDTTVTGLYAFNVSDAFRTSDATNWRVEHSWAHYVRDDGIENDRLRSGTIYDTLFDGVYTAFSARPDAPDTSVDGRGNLMTIDRVLARLQAQPYPYKWKEGRNTIDAAGRRHSGKGMPYGHGLLFKYEENRVPGRNMHFAIRDSVFMAEHISADKNFDFPDESLIDECRNVSVIWLGPGEYPGQLPTRKFPNCVKVVTGQAGRDLWRQKVSDWHERHPNVGLDHKPASPGTYAFPQVF